MNFQKINTRNKKWITSLGLLFIVMSQSVLAEHFHYFIDIETTYTVNQQNQLNALNISWVYDEKMSVLMKKQNPNLQELGQTTLNDLRKHDYFTHIQFNGKPVKTGQVTQFNLQEFTENGQTALQLDFTLPLLQPLNMKGNNKLTWSFSDPSGLAIMVYFTPKNIRLGGVLQSHCKPLMRENKSAEHGDPAQLLSLQCSI